MFLSMSVCITNKWKESQLQLEEKGGTPLTEANYETQGRVSTVFKTVVQICIFRSSSELAEAE